MKGQPFFIASYRNVAYASVRLKYMIKIVRKFEFEISSQEHSTITLLRKGCFDSCQRERSYFKQLPHFRYLAVDNNAIVGMVGVDHRMISIDGAAYSIFGIIDLCVAASHRGQGIAAALMMAVESQARLSDIDFLMLMADNHAFYSKFGFELRKNYCAWLRINDFKNYGIAFEKLDQELMSKCLGKKKWPDGMLDFLGYLF